MTRCDVLATGCMMRDSGWVWIFSSGFVTCLTTNTPKMPQWSLKYPKHCMFEGCDSEIKQSTRDWVFFRCCRCFERWTSQVLLVQLGEFAMPGLQRVADDTTWSWCKGLTVIGHLPLGYFMVIGCYRSNPPIEFHPPRITIVTSLVMGPQHEHIQIYPTHSTVSDFRDMTPPGDRDLVMIRPW